MVFFSTFHNGEAGASGSHDQNWKLACTSDSCSAPGSRDVIPFLRPSDERNQNRGSQIQLTTCVAN